MAGDMTTIARPYAEAVFAHAKETDQLDRWSQALELLALVTTDPDLVAQLGNPSIPRAQTCALILEVCGGQIHAEAAHLVRLLSDNARLTTLPEIAHLFEVSRIADQGVRHVSIRSAFAMSAEEQASLATALANRLGGRVELTVETDSALIGGIEVRAGDLVIDGSVRGKIKQLANALQF